MKILKAIGGVFVKIWRWIKNTAWVQPLLIVGVIFGVIFSIPSITSGIQGLINGANSADAFYGNFKKSLEGGETSDADKLIKNYWQYEEEQNGVVPEDEQKFFLFFNASGNDTTKEIKAAFEILRDNWGTTYKPTDTTDTFRLYTIFTDETTSETSKHESAFEQFLSRRYSFFERASEVGLESNYYINGKVTEDDLNELATPVAEKFKIPTIILIDWKNKVYDQDKNKEPGITQVMFDVPGSDSYEKAKVLRDCWNNKGDFSINPND